MSNKTKYFSGISLLRALATLGIMLYHVGYGQYYLKSFNLSAGIHIFFCISAFLLMYSTQNKTAGNFLIGRLIRILPLYIIITLATFIGAKLITSLGDGDITVSELIHSLLLLPFAREGLKGDNVIRPILGPAWTLYYEIWFAVLFTIVMKIKHKARGIVSAAVCIAAYLLALIIPGDLAVLRLLRTGFILDFAAGIAIFWIWKNCSLFFLQIPRYVYIILTTVLFGFFYLAPRNTFLLCILASLMLLCAVFGFENKTIIKPVSLFADISYSFYLIHYYLIIILGKFFNFNAFSIKTVIGTIAVFAGTFICAVITHILIEKKLSSILTKIIIKKRS